MAIFFNPNTKNMEVWDTQPDGYLTEAEGLSVLMAEEPQSEPPTEEERYDAERFVVFQKYERPYDGASGGILNVVRMTHAAALMALPQNADTITGISEQYQAELANMKAEYDAIDKKYGVN